MADRKELKLSIPGIVHYNYIQRENGKRVVSVTVTDEYSEWFENLIATYGMEFSGTAYPLKQDMETGENHIVTRTGYEVALSGMPKYTDIEDIGKGSKVDLIAKLVEGEARGKKYVSAYLLGIKMHEFVAKEIVDVFDSKDLVEMPATAGNVKPKEDPSKSPS